MKHQGNPKMTIQNIITIERKALENTKTQCQKFSLSAQKLRHQKKCKMNF